jgi:hypothetical protein
MYWPKVKVHNEDPNTSLASIRSLVSYKSLVLKNQIRNSFYSKKYGNLQGHHHPVP